MGKYVRPTLDTKFHIDFSWWQEKGRNFRIQLEGDACAESKERYQELQDQTFDWIHPETGEVFELNILWHLIHKYCSQAPDFIDEYTPLTTAIFRAFLSNDNLPLTPVELHQVIQKKTPETILRTIGGHRVYNGIRPVVYSA